MPDLNPESLRAACDAMRAAYRPDCILLRPDAMEAAIRAYLAAEAERVAAEPEDDDMIVQCEGCDAKHHMDETMCTDDGCYICPKCAAEWRETVRACKHEWSPQADAHGDPGQFCGRCSVLIRDEDMADFLAGRIAP